MCKFLCWFCGKVLSLSLISPLNFQVGGRRHRRALLPGKYPSPFSHFHQHPVPSSNLQKQKPKNTRKICTSYINLRLQTQPAPQPPKPQKQSQNIESFLLSTFYLQPHKTKPSKGPSFLPFTQQPLTRMPDRGWKKRKKTTSTKSKAMRRKQ